jgi:hypothetical protein
MKLKKQARGEEDGVVSETDAAPFADGPCAGESKVLEDPWCRVAHARESVKAGFSLIVNMVQDKSPRAFQLIDAFQRELGMQASVNLYYTPMGSQAFDIHYDVQDAFILQVRGLDMCAAPITID